MIPLMVAQPHPAATLVLVRDAAGVEVLLSQRHQASRFAGGDFVFPGGKIESDDDPDNAVAWCRGLTPEIAARRLGLDDSRAAVAYWVGAIREAFEEVGVLLAYGPDGGFVRPTHSRYEEYRRACQEDNRTFWEMVRNERLTLATDRLVYFAHWITPEESPVRFDTRFFATSMPPDQVAIADDREIVGIRWLTPAAALQAYEDGEISLRFPTIKNLTLLEGGASAADTLARLTGRAVETIRPRVVVDGDSRRVLIPGDPGYF
jgi:8-oxo-dGTP pyrophosphatase MutT (NUDIX family)